MHAARRKFPLLLPLAALAACGGCSREAVGRVSGTVTLDGQPLSGAVVVIEDAKRGISVNAPLDAQGAFVARTFDKPGLPPGTYQVAIRPGGFGSGEQPLVGDAPPGFVSTAAAKVPPRYHSVKTSGLTVSVAAGSNPPLRFSLSSR